MREFTVEDLRIMVGQNIGLRFLIPIALEHLLENPLAAGHFYSGDLLAAVLRVETKFWIQRPDLRQDVAALVQKTLSQLGQLEEIERRSVEKALTEAHQLFQTRSHIEPGQNS